MIMTGSNDGEAHGRRGGHRFRAWARGLALVPAMAMVPVLAGPPADADTAPPSTNGLVWEQGGRGERYVALGDSAAAGPLIPGQRTNPLGCFRSDRNFPTLLAKQLKAATFNDVTCSGAKTPDMTSEQDTPLGVNPPQFDALGRDTTLVTFGPIGANDAGLTDLVLKCINLLPPPAGKSCAERYTAGGKDANAEVIDALAPAIGTLLAGVHRRAPKARVYVIGYGRYLPPGGCYPTQPIWGKDADYIQHRLIDRVNSVLAGQAAKNDAHYVSLQSPTASDHTACAPLGQRWLQGLIPDSPSISLHPSALGMSNFGDIIADAIQTDRGGEGGQR